MNHISALAPASRLIHASQLDNSRYQWTACAIASAMTIALEYGSIPRVTVAELATRWDPEMNGIPDTQLAELLTREFHIPAIVGQTALPPYALSVDYGKIPAELRSPNFRYPMSRAYHWLAVQELGNGEALVSDPLFPVGDVHGVYRIPMATLLEAADYMGLPAADHRVGKSPVTP